MVDLLDVDHLGIGIARGDSTVSLVEDVSFTIRAGESYGIVGESGCGKSTTIRAIIRLLTGKARITQGSVRFDGVDLAQAKESALQSVRGAGIGMVFQDPLTALNPVITVGQQIAEGLRYHGVRSAPERRARMLEAMRLVGLPDPARIAASYPHELSGGQRQRAAIAIALIASPRLLLADEPTTALDVTIQAQILRLLTDLRSRLGMALVLVTHDLGVVAQTCDRVAVMYSGRIVEEAPIRRIFEAPRHPYTVALLNSIPRGTRAGHPLHPIAGMPPDPAQRPPGCSFAPRCPNRQEDCEVSAPGWTQDAGGGGFACFHPALATAEATHG
ncbi:ABC transporter ATP-binding protein [Acidisoma cellulosilytica]|uniref:ABC transporter ATP-binding protein n=1 Tax=Acidisoma cellulosilyticum TaxID=2802395 RepID=A0A964E5P1_9PROT|nr:ABC transporter ATP-binding protein [Acidisoma cellulosilyticum]MCB8882183.1 ABC transporter ATP-binding protein [Acidisoma cellulosilyticum]